MSLLGSIFGCSSCAKVDDLNLAELRDRDVMIIDVRTLKEFSAGHIDESVNVPVQSISAYIDQIKKEQRPVITYCRSGKRSEVARTILRAKGIEVYNGGGFGDFAKQWNDKSVKV